MKKSIKKGFTLVELLVVIAIIAILSVVGIVGYVSFTNRARISNDTTIVTELNRVMQAEHVNKDVKNMQQIVEEVHNAGFILTKLTPTASKHNIVYDMDADRFFLLNEKNEVVAGDPNKKLSTEKWKRWKVVQSYAEVSGEDFSFYLGEMKGDKPAALNVQTGIDVGENTIAQINYTGTSTVKDDVVIRTNGGTLTVDAPNDNLTHYGYAEVVDIQKVKESSYHERGTVPFIKVKAGHVAVEEDGWVNAVHVIKKTDSSFDEVKVTVKSNDVPKFSRDAVTINAGQEVKVCTVTIENDTNAIYLTQDGIYEQIKYAAVANDVESSEKTFVVGDASSSKMNTIADQISNNIAGEEDVDYTIDPTTKELTIINQDIEVEEGGKEAYIAQTESEFKGTGTEKDPFLIYDYVTFMAINDNFENGYRYYKVKDGVSAINCNGLATNVNLNGSFDGNGVTFTNVNAECLFRNLYTRDTNKEIVLKNFNVDSSVKLTNGNGASLIRQVNSNAIIKNINSDASIIGTNGHTSGLIGYTHNKGSQVSDSWIDYSLCDCSYVIIDNCHITSTILFTRAGANDGVAAGFIGMVDGDAQSNKKTSITINNSSFDGVIYTCETAYNQARYYVGQSENQNWTIDGVSQEVNVYLTLNDKWFKTLAIINPTIKSGNSGYQFTKATNAVRATINFEGRGSIGELNGYGFYFYSEEMELTGNGDITINMGYITEIRMARGDSSLSNYSNGIFTIYSPNYDLDELKSPNLQVVQYDALGNVVATGSLSLTCITPQP